MINKKQVVLAAVAALGLSAGQAMASGQAGLYLADFDDVGDGFGLEGHFDVTPTVRLSGDLLSVDEDDFNTELDILRLRGGYLLHLVDDDLELEIGGSFQNWDRTMPDGMGGTMSADDDAFGFHVQAAFSVTPEFSIGGGFEYVTFDDELFIEDETIINLRADYALGNFGLFFGYDMYDEMDNDLIKIGGAFRF